MTATIELHDIGPIEEFSYALDGHGVHELRGTQGKGKTTILRTVQLVTDGRTDVQPTKRDGTPKGEATVAGRRINITKRVTQSGDLTVEGLGDLDLASLHTPRFKDATTRDQHRIRALIRLANVTPDASLFGDTTGIEFAEADDLVDMAGKVKRAQDAVALGFERQADELQAEAQGLRKSIAGIDLNAETNSATLTQRASDATRHHAGLIERQLQCREAATRSRTAREQLDAMRNDPNAISVADAAAEQEAAMQRQTAASDAVARLQTELDRARDELQAANDECDQAATIMAASQQRNVMIMQFEQTLTDATRVAEPTLAELEAAAQAEHAAQTAIATGAACRHANEQIVKAVKAEQESIAIRQRAKRARAAANKTQTVLADAIRSIPNCPLRIEYDNDGNPRIVLETARNKATNLDELSDGERWDVLLPLCCAPDRIVVLSQAAWGELAPATRDRIDALARLHQCYILTAIADDGDLRAVPYRRG